MHLLWISDSPDTPSGFGNVTRFVCQGLAQRGHRVSILGWQTRAPMTWNGCQVYPIGADPLGSDALYAFLLRHRPDLVIALGDVWWLPFFAAPHVRRQMELADIPWLLYFPIDGNTADGRLPPSWIELLRAVDVPIAMSRYGQRVVNDCGVRCDYIPHGVDLDIFCPPADREQAKERIGARGKFVVLSDSRNQPRKMLPRLLDIFAKFTARCPDALLHLHTDPEDEFTRSGYYSYDIRADVKQLGLEARVRFTPALTMKHRGGIPLDELAAYYQAADVHLLASSGEGFGLPTLQAAAAGAVPMASAYSASQELAQGHGEAIRIAEWTETQFGIRRALIDVDDAAEKLTCFYNDRDLLRSRSAQAREFALAYGWKRVVDQWDGLIRSIGQGHRRIRQSLYRPVDRPEQVFKNMIPSIPGVSVKVQVAQRELGKLEAGLLADANRAALDVRLPIVPPPCEINHVRVIRKPGRVCLDALDAPLLSRLKLIFPILSGWSPVSERGEPIEGIESVLVSTLEEARLELAQSVLVLNVGGRVPGAVLIDAALFGVPCIGAGVDAQRALYPELVAEDHLCAFDLARALLTNPAFSLRVSEHARRACERLYSPNLDDAAAGLRRLYHVQRIDVAAAVGG